MPVRRALVVARLADERPRDHAADRVLAREDLARLPAALVQLLERDRLLVRGDLEDGVRRRVDDPLARLLVLLAELLDDLGARRRLVAEHAARRRVHERVDDVVREAVRVRRQGLRRDDAHHLPVAERRVLPFERSSSRPATAGAPCMGATPSSGRDVAEPERLHGRQVETADGARDVAEGVRALVSELCCVRQGACAHTVEHDDARARHVLTILEPWRPFSDCSASPSTSRRSSRSPPASPGLVVKLSPGTKDAAAKAKN